MSDLKVCKICLRIDSKLYRYEEFKLKYYYEQLLAFKITAQNHFPKYFCFECATMLYKFHKFKEKCLTGHKVLKELLRNKDCGEHFPTQKDFVKHHLAAHPRVPIILPYERHICEICGISLATNSDKKPYPCSLCEKWFSRNAACSYRTFHLKQPYPKKNRRKRSQPEEIPLSQYRN